MAHQPSVYYSVPQWLYDKLLSWYPKEKVAAYLEAVVSQSGHPMYVHCHTGRYGIEEIVSSLEKEGISVTKAPYAVSFLSSSGTHASHCSICILSAWQRTLFSSISSNFSHEISRLNTFVVPPFAFARWMLFPPGAAHISIQKLFSCGATHWAASAEERKETADYVLADVPCSGLGILSRKPDIKYQLTQERLTELVSLQREILVNAAKLVKPGGVLV